MRLFARCLSLLLVLMVLGGAVPSSAMEGAENARVYYEGNVIIRTPDGNAVWVGITYDDSEVVNHTYRFPLEVGISSLREEFLGSFNLVGFADRDRYDHGFRNSDYMNVAVVVLPASYTQMPYNAFEYENTLTAFETDADNPVLEAVDGVLYNKVESTLVAYPNARPGEHFDVPAGTKAIGPMAFGISNNYTTWFTSITLPEGLERIGFKGLLLGEKVTELVVPGSLREIDEFAFEGTNLTTFAIPDTLETIAGNPFMGQKVPALEISDTHPTMRLTENMLYNMAQHRLLIHTARQAAEGFTLPDETTGIAAGAFTYVDVTPAGTLVIPEGVTEIGARAFEYATIDAITLPGTLTTIGPHAFVAAKGMKDITVPGSVGTIQRNTFAGSELETAKLGEGIVAIAADAFRSCANLSSLTMPASLTEIGPQAFAECQALPSLTLPAGLLSIGDSAFRNNNSLQAVQLPEGLQSLDEYAFSNCQGLTAVQVPGSVKALEKGVFTGCSSLSEVRLHEGLETIGRSAFAGCMALSALTIPRSVTSIDQKAFTDAPVTLSVYAGSPAEAIVQELGLPMEIIP